MATERMNRSWRKIRDRIKEAWPEEEFEDTNMKKTRGSLRKMITLIEAKTGEPRPEIRSKIVAVM